MLRMGRGSKADQAGSEKYRDNSTGTPTGGAPQNYVPQQVAATELRSSLPVPQTPKAMTDGEMLARDIKEGKLSGFVGSGTVMTGEATFRGMLRVDGHLTGRVMSDDGTLIVGTGGQVDADIEVAIAIVNGTVNGDIIASQRLELGRAARVSGNIQTPALMVEQGAIFEGSCRMVQIKAALEKQREAKSGDSGAVAEPTQPETVEEDTSAPSDVASAAGAAS
jgi:cytoskeletal protein CcmA (bactofilin family)